MREPGNDGGRRNETLAAAAEAFLSSGGRGPLPLAAMAERLGRPVAWSELPDEQTLVRYVAAGYLAGLGDATRRAVVGIDDPLEQLAVRGKVYVQYALANSAAYRRVFLTDLWVLGAHRLDEVVRGFTGLVANAEACLASGRLRADLTDVSRVCLSWWAGVHGLAALMVGGELDASPVGDLVDWFVDDHVGCLAA